MKKGKIFFLIGLSLVMYLGFFSISGCDNTKETISLVEVYPELEENPLSITVTMNDSYTGSFMIDDSTQIISIMQILRTRTYYLQESNIPSAPLGNKTMAFNFAGGENISISTRSVIYGKDKYACNNDGLGALLEEIGLEKGEIIPR